MFDLIDGVMQQIFVLAQDGEALGSSSGTQPAGGTTAPGGAAPTGPAGGGGGLLFIMLPFLGLMIWMMISQGRKAKKEQAARAEMLGSIKRFDSVQTVGGVIGTVQELSENRVVLKVDDSGTRVTFSRSAVQQVLETKSAEIETVQQEPQMAGQTA
ncbi:MAG: preprotein translocase subunit YajC [Planctomycetota bacterium]